MTHHTGTGLRKQMHQEDSNFLANLLTIPTAASKQIAQQFRRGFGAMLVSGTPSLQPHGEVRVPVLIRCNRN
jgi:hypothetical protein